MPDPSDVTSPSLLASLRAQDPEAWRRLVRIYGPMVYGWARKAGVQANDAADIVQEVFATVSGHIEDFRHDQPGDSFRAWLWTICGNRIRRHFRELLSRPVAVGGSSANLRLQDLAEAPPEESSEEGSREVSQLRRRALLEYRDRFGDQVWEAFWAVVAEERKPAEVAETLGISVWAVYKAKARVLQRLRQELEGFF